MSIYNNIKITSPPIRLPNGDVVPSLDSGSLEEVATMAPIMGSFRATLKGNSGGVYIPLEINPPRTTNSYFPATYPYNTMHIKGIALKEQTPFNVDTTITAGFDVWTNISNPYFMGIVNLPDSVNDVSQYPIVSANDASPLPSGYGFENAPYTSIIPTWDGEGIRLTFQQSSQVTTPYFIRGQYLLM